jgi:alpha-2-macroglobulin
VRIRHAGQARDPGAPIALVQLTNLAVHGRLGVDEGMVWVTGVDDGKPRADVAIAVHDAAGQVRARARTDEQGLARLTGLRPATATEDCGYDCNAGFEGYVAAVLGDDRAVVGLNAWDPDLAAWNFGIPAAWSAGQRIPAAAAVFTERGIYRPGERVYAKAIVRTGTLGALRAPRGDSLKWEFLDREYSAVRDTVTPLSSFGTADQSLLLTSDVSLGFYTVRVSLQHGGGWHVMAEASYQVAEYRPPEFLVDVNAETTPRFGGDTVPAGITARYLFGAPMAGARVRWVVQHQPVDAWELDIPGADGWQIGGYGFDEHYHEQSPTTATERVDSLDAHGALDIAVPMPVLEDGRAARAGILAIVSDANRQTVTAGAQRHRASGGILHRREDARSRLFLAGGDARGHRCGGAAAGRRTGSGRGCAGGRRAQGVASGATHPQRPAHRDRRLGVRHRDDLPRTDGYRAGDVSVHAVGGRIVHGGVHRAGWAGPRRPHHAVALGCRCGLRAVAR